MNISRKVFKIEESASRIDRILDVQNTIIKVDGDYDLLSIQPHQVVDCKVACVCVTLHINKYDLDKDDTLFIQYKCLLSEIGALLSEVAGAIDYSVMTKITLAALVRVDNTENLNKVIDVAAKICSLLSIINRKFTAKNFSAIMLGIGISYDKARLTKEAFTNEGDPGLLWQGDVVDESIKLSQNARTGFLGNSLMISKSVFEKLTDVYKNFFSYDNSSDSFVSSLINKSFEAWEKEHL